MHSSGQQLLGVRINPLLHVTGVRSHPCVKQEWCVLAVHNGLFPHACHASLQQGHDAPAAYSRQQAGVAKAMH
jgi:hypothetical protein